MSGAGQLPPVAILAGGLATGCGRRANIAKAMLEVAGEPFIAHQLRLLAREGIDKVVLRRVSRRPSKLSSAMARLSACMSSIRASRPNCSVPAAPCATRCRYSAMNSWCSMAIPYLATSYAPIMCAFRRSGRQAMMTVFRNEGRWDTSNVEFVDGEIRNYDKQQRTTAMEFIDYGLGAFKANALLGWKAWANVSILP